MLLFSSSSSLQSNPKCSLTFFGTAGSEATEAGAGLVTGSRGPVTVPLQGRRSYTPPFAFAQQDDRRELERLSQVRTSQLLMNLYDLK